MNYKTVMILLCLLIMNSGRFSECKDLTGRKLPPIETFIIEPIELDNISVWVPAAKSGPFINRSCRAEENISCSLAIPAEVNQQKTLNCPAEVARILAETTAVYYESYLPLTIFNGWQWEFTYKPCQFESISYNLPEGGGCWENCWEAVMALSYGRIKCYWLNAESLETYEIKKTEILESSIEVINFSSMRIRDGYPKERQLKS